MESIKVDGYTFQLGKVKDGLIAKGDVCNRTVYVLGDSRQVVERRLRRAIGYCNGKRRLRTHPKLTVVFNALWKEAA